MSRVTSHCRLCGNEALKPVIDLGRQPLSGVFPRPADADPTGSPLELVRCDTSARADACGLVQLRHSAEVAEMYGATYGYFSSISPTMVSHLQGIAKRVLDVARPAAGDIVLDIGCNDGTLLNQYAGLGLTRIGMDPSSRKFASRFQPDIRVEFDFFSEAGVRAMVGERQCRIITSIAMFYDLDDPLGFMSQVRSLLAEDGVWALELSYLPLFLKQLTYDQLCHEHLTYIGLRELEWMMRRTGLKILDVSFNDVNGGSFFVLAAREDSPLQADTAKIQRILEEEQPLATDVPYERFARRVANHRDEVRHFLSLARAAGKRVYGYGASTKGNIVLNYCGVGPQDLVAIGDRNPEKDGLVTPGSRIPIISHEKLRAARPDYLFVLIWHFRREVIQDEMEFLERGGKMVLDLPRLHVVDRENCRQYLDAPFEDLAFPL